MTARYHTLSELAGLPAAEFLQHRPPMLLLDTLVEATETGAICEWTVTAHWPFVAAGKGIPAYVGVEFMAQCVAVHAGARARVDGYRPPLGFLLGTRHFRSSTPWFGLHQTYRVSCVEQFRDASGMGSYDCIISENGISLAEARLSVLEKEKGKALGD